MENESLKKHSRPARPSVGRMFRGFCGAFMGIGAVAAMDQFFLHDADLLFVIGAFGATAVLVFGAPSSPLAQPYNVVVGHLISALIGVAVFKLVGDVSWLSASLAVSVAIVAMQATRSVHPPGGATALIAVVSSPEMHELGFLYAIYPVGAGAVILVMSAYISNNIFSKRRWPVFWL